MSVEQFITQNPAEVRTAMVALGVAKIKSNSSLTTLTSAYALMDEEQQSALLSLVGYDKDAVVEDVTNVQVTAPTISGVDYLVGTSAPSKTFPQGKTMRYAMLPVHHFSNNRNPVVLAGNVEIAVVLGTQFSLYSEKNPLKVGDLIAVKMQADMNGQYNNGLDSRNIGGRLQTVSQLYAEAMPEFQEWIAELEAHNASKPTLKTEIARLQANSKFNMSNAQAKAILLEEERIALAEHNKKQAQARIFKY